MTNSLPYTFEDRTGSIVDTDFDEMYDRAYFKVGPSADAPGTSTSVYEMRHRASRHRDISPLRHERRIRLDFAKDRSLGNIVWWDRTSIPMARFLKKVSVFGTSLQRKFTASDGREYAWTHRSVAEHEWTCATAENYLVAHYSLKRDPERVYDVSGHTFTVYEPFLQLSMELIASLLIMRHIQHHHL
ncbi:hypothetical protein BD626DRAFT_513899 [Schizophyllum amplum]|uniref:Tubby C-terminal-like domain-containing protein n=1 Tax=Schizophyllum amplum TaxID=97359 RepID=A0A550BYW4_9AGAR|nr:hypothetical protein BD626DRAFT_513899 [Auriculariopsis ampla]